MRIAHVSDLHFGAEDPAIPQKLAQTLHEASPDLTIVSGDLTQHGSRREMQMAAAFLDQLPQPLLIIPGNHDMPPLWRPVARFRHPWTHFRECISPSLEPLFLNEQVLAVGLNSNRPGGFYLDWSRGRLSPSQLNHLSNVCSQAPPHLLKILVIHHPPAPPPQGTVRHLIGRLSQMLPAIHDSGIDLILSGHFHQSYAIEMPLPPTSHHPIPKNCVLSVASTATSHRLKGEPNGYHWIEGDRQRLMICSRTWNPQTQGFVPQARWVFLNETNQRWTSHAVST